MAWGVSSSYLQQKKYRQVQPRTTPNPKVVAASQTYDKILINIIQGGGRTTYTLRGQRATFYRTSDPKVYSGNVLASQKSFFYSGRNLQLSCGCGGGKKTIGVIQ